MAFNKKKIKKFFRVTTVVTGAAFVTLSVIAQRCKKESTYEYEPQEQNPMEGRKVVFVADDSEAENADGRRGHLEAIGDTDYHQVFMTGM